MVQLSVKKIRTLSWCCKQWSTHWITHHRRICFRLKSGNNGSIMGPPSWGKFHQGTKFLYCFPPRAWNYSASGKRSFKNHTASGRSHPSVPIMLAPQSRWHDTSGVCVDSCKVNALLKSDAFWQWRKKHIRPQDGPASWQTWQSVQLERWRYGLLPSTWAGASSN